MADFMAVTACSHPKLKAHKRIETILDRFYVDPDLSIGVGFDEVTGAPQLFLYGYCWPKAWRIPRGVARADFDPYDSDEYGEGADGFVQLLKEIAPCLEEPLTVQAVGSTKCWFPLSACEWHITPGSTQVEMNEFRHSFREPAAAPASAPAA